MEPFNFGFFPVVTIWWLSVFHVSAQYQDMVCENPGSRHGRKMTVPGPECDMTDKDWCTVKTTNYPEEKLMEIILDNRGIMKRLFGDQREARFLESSFDSAVDSAPKRPPPRYKPKKKESGSRKGTSISSAEETNEETFGLQNGRFPDTDVLATSRHGKKIDNGDPAAMKVITIQAYVDEQKTNKDSDDYDVKRSKTKTFETSPSNNSLDNVLFKTIDIAIKRTTNTSNVTNEDVIETTETPILVDDATENEDSFTLESPDGGFVTEGTPKDKEQDSLEDPATITPVSEATSKDPTKEKEVEKDTKKEDVAESRTEPFRLKITGSTSHVPLDSGDDLRYTLRPTSKTELPKTTQKHAAQTNSLRTQDSENPKPRPTDRRRQPTKDLLEGRVEYQNWYKNQETNNNQGQGTRFGNPVASFPASSILHQVPPSSKKNPNMENPSSSYSGAPDSAYPRPDHRLPPGGSPPYPMEKFPACNSTSEVIAPTWAKNIQGKNLIVVNVGSFMQHLHVEECEKSSLYRKMYCQRGCRCEQQYRLQKLLVIDPDDECRGIFSDWFRFPSCCICVCYPASMPRGGSRSARIVHEDEEYMDDDYVEDLDDPFVDHYYGLDLDPEGDDADVTLDDLQMSSSSQTSYVSFTDIDSIDRSFRSEIPDMYVEESQRRSDGPGTFRQVSSRVRPHYNELVKNASMAGATKDKKSRLLGGFNRTVNIRPQFAPRRLPPPRIPVPAYAFPFVRPPSLPGWGTVYRSFPPVNGYSLNSSPNQVPQFSAPRLPNIKWATPSPAVAGATLGTLNAATAPYYKWSRDSRTLNQEVETSGTENDKKGKGVLTRIPRSASDDLV